MSQEQKTFKGVFQNISSWPLSLLPTTSWDQILDPEEENKREKEMKSMQAVKFALKNYRSCSYVHIIKREDFIKSLPESQQIKLSSYRQHLSHVRDCIDKNQDVINQILRVADDVPDSNGRGIKLGPEAVEKQTPPELKDMIDEHFKIFKAQSFLKLIARDWSDACAEEREQSYKPIIDAIEEFFPPKQYEPNDIKILVPGAGLGRLTYELASRGYETEGNEFSFFMLMSSYFILNRCAMPRAFVVYPWIHQYLNNLNASDHTAFIQFPDICPKKTAGNISIMAGDFLETYNDADGKYDCVATCFFIDCANNIVDFIETIHRILVPDGIWVNLGPLLYNYCEIKGENSIEPTYDQLIPIIKETGFEILRTQTGVRTRYAQNPKSMLKSEYESVFWVCKKNSHQLQLGHNNDYGLCRNGNLNNGNDNREQMNYNGYNKFNE